MVVDSVPVRVVKLARERTYRAFRKNFEKAPAKDYSAVNRGWFIGFKLHVVIFDWTRSMYMRSGYSKIPISLAKVTGSAKILKNEIRDGLLYVVTAHDDHDPQLMIPIATPLPKPDINFSLAMKPSIIYAGLITITFLFLIVLLDVLQVRRKMS